ncbi:MAG: reductive dehalogenase domain-containing protein [Desulfobacterales bacterium]|nr:reductive dehalogenase domain-containing protein [Desulfobacterales bacterium]
MKNRRMVIILAFLVWWGGWGMLLSGIPFKIGKAKMYSPEQGMGPNPYVGLDIKNVQRFSMRDFASFIYGNQPSRGPKGSTFDMVNRRKEIPQVASVIHNTTRFGSPEMVESLYGPVNPKKVDLPDRVQLTKFIKDLCKYFGSVDVGIADLGTRPDAWFFEDDSFGYPTYFKPEEHKYAIVALNEEKQSTHPYPTGWDINSIKYYSKVSKNYWDDDYVVGQVSELIRMMGYQAWGHNNAYTRNVPLAIMAGLGEYGRFGNLITLNWGSNVRICAITTNLPLIPDEPIDIGVADFCSMCTRCYDYCPTRAIPIEKIDYMGVNKYTQNFWRCRRSTIVGIPNLVDASTCTLCRDVCPFVKDTKYLGNKIGRIMVGRSHIGRKFLINLDYLLYTKWNRHGLGKITTERRTLLREASEKYPEGDWSKDWFTVGATDQAGRRIYRKKNPAGLLAVPKGGIGIFHPFYTKADLEDPNFGKWPGWTDIWGRKIPGYEEGAQGAPRLNMRPTVQIIGSTVLSGVAGSPLISALLKGIPPEEGKNQLPDTWCGAGFDTACNNMASSYAW